MLRKIYNNVICPFHIPPNSNEVKNKMKNRRHFLFQIDVKDVVFVVGLKPTWLQPLLLLPGEKGPGALVPAPRYWRQKCERCPTPPHKNFTALV